jgi:hypothetical protein
MAKKHGRIADDDQEWEDHLIIRFFLFKICFWTSFLFFRFPQNVQEAIREYVTQEAHASDRLSLNFNQDLRTGTITFDKKKMPFTLYDLPTITEVYIIIMIYFKLFFHKRSIKPSTK